MNFIVSNSATAQQRNSATAQQRNSATAQQRNSADSLSVLNQFSFVTSTAGQSALWKYKAIYRLGQWSDVVSIAVAMP